MESINTIKKDIKSFINSNKKVLNIPYNGDDLNPRRFWHRIIFKNRVRLILRSLVLTFTTVLPGSSFKNSILRKMGMNIGKDVFIALGVLFDNEFPRLITIKDGVIIGFGTKILTHEVTIKDIRIGRISIGEQCLIGAGSMIRSGVTIGDRAVVGMKSLVLEDVSSDTTVGGVPTQVISKN